MELKRIILVYPGKPLSRVQKAVYVHLPYSSLCLAAYVRERGYEADVLDMRVADWSGRDFSDIHAVGIGCMTGHQIRYGLELAACVRKQNPEAPIIWGGVHPTLHPEQTAKHDLVDYVVRGEGEQALFELLEALNDKLPIEKVAGITFVRDNQVVATPERDPIKELDSLPFPAYDLINLDDYPNARDVFDYQSSRGCPFRCAFCYNLRFSKRRWRGKSAERVVSDIKKIKQAYGVRSVGFVDDELFINPKRTEEIVGGLLRENIRVGWIASCRVDIIQRYSDDALRKLRDSGCWKLYFGAESGSQRMLDMINKDIKVDDIFGAAEKCVRNDIIPVFSFMAGFPGETAEDMEKTYQAIGKLWKLDSRIEVNGCFIYNPYPGARLFDKALESGMDSPSDLAGWGAWEYKYDAAWPWVDAERRRIMRTRFLLVRFSYYWKELGNRPDYAKKYLIRALLLPLKMSFSVRWNRNLLAHAYEWEVWAKIVEKAFGFM